MFHNFCQSFCLTILKNVVGGPFCVPENFGYRKISWIGEQGCVSRVFVKVFVSQSRKKSDGNPSLFKKKLAFEKTYGQWGISLFSIDNFSSHSTEKFRRGTHLCFRELRVSKFFFCIREEGYITIFCQNLCLTVPKNFVGQTFCVSKKNRVSEKRTDINGTSLFSVDIFWFHSAEKIRAETLR